MTAAQSVVAIAVVGFLAGGLLIKNAAKKAPATPPQPIYPVDLIDGREIYPEDET